jgi:hypothetical protein
MAGRVVWCLAVFDLYTHDRRHIDVRAPSRGCRITGIVSPSFLSYSSGDQQRCILRCRLCPRCT